MDKHSIYKKYENEFVGYFVTKHYENNDKQLNKTDIRLLRKYTYAIWFNKNQMLEDRLINISGTTYAINKRANVEDMSAYLGNYWSSYCRLGRKTGLINICSSDYGIENVCVGLFDTGLESITKQMYEDLEQLHTSKKECA